MTLVATVRRHRLVSFFALAYAFTWVALFWDSFFAPGALVAALVVVSITEGRVGLRDLGARVVRWRVAPIWYVAALGIPLTIHVVAVTTNVALGAEAATVADQLMPWYGIPLAIAMSMVNPTGGPLSEEPSFRGYAVPWLQTRHTPLGSATVLALAVTGWHAPLFVVDAFDLQPVHVATTMAITFWYVWLFDHAAGSALITLIAHAAEGSVDIESLFHAGADATRQDYLYAATWVTCVVVLVLVDRSFWTRPASSEATHPPPPPFTAVSPGART